MNNTTNLLDLEGSDIIFSDIIIERTENLAMKCSEILPLY